jgi:hypothetical protein
MNELRDLLEELYEATFFWGDLPEHVVDDLSERVEQAICQVRLENA